MMGGSGGWWTLIWAAAAAVVLGRVARLGRSMFLTGKSAGKSVYGTAGLLEQLYP